MTERDLNSLKDMAIPPARDAARTAALDAALEEFDSTALAVGSTQGESEAPKGNVIPFGQTKSSEPKRRFFRMDFSLRTTQALAASIAALIVVAPIAFNELSKSGLPNSGEFAALKTQLPAPPPARKDEAAVTAAHIEPAPAPAPSTTSQATPEATLAPVVPRNDDVSRYRDIAKQEPKAPALTDGKKVDALAETPPAAVASPVDAERFSNSGVEEKAAELSATTARKGNRRTEIAVLPDPNIPKEISEGLGGAPKDGTAVLSQTPNGPELRQKEIAKGKALQERGLVAGKQSLAADNAQIGTDFSGTLFPQNGVTFDGGQARVSAPAPAAQAPAPAAPAQAPASGAGGASVASLEAPSSRVIAPAKPDLNAATGRRMLESDKYGSQANLNQPHDPYAWMGHADEQKAVAIEESRDRFDSKEINPVKQVATEPVSTFSIDVDTASYAFVRGALNAGHLPPRDAVRVEEMINYFPYNYPAPESAEVPFKPSVNVFASPWNPQHKLVHVAIKGYDLKTSERPRANIVLLMDVSGSMEPADRLPLVKNAFRMLVDQLQPDDTVGIVTYAGESGIALEPTRVSEKWRIQAAIDRLGAGGSTAGAAGIADAYRLAEQNFDKRAVNRVILATDGDFNVGITNQDELKSFIERKRQTGIFLSILGVGKGNHNDALMQALAQNGNGTAAYTDTLSEARKVLVEESSSTLFTIAKDVKIQIEWNPERISEYRLIGYESRNLKREDFNNDRVDAGDIGSGHTVTAIYEVTPVGAPQVADDLRYGKKLATSEPRPAPGAAPRDVPQDRLSGELGFLKLRYKRPSEDVSQLVSLAITDADRTVADAASDDVRFSTAVAAFGQMLKSEPYTLGYGFDDILSLAQNARGSDPFGYRAEFLNLVRLAKSARP